MKDKNHDYLNRPEKLVDKIQHPVMIKMQQIGDRKNIAQHNKGHL